MRLATLVLLALASSLHAQSVKLPAEVKVQPGRLAAVTVEWDGDDIKWTAPADLDLFREYDPDPKKVRLRLIGYTTGKYEVKAVACKAGKLSEFATCVVVVGTPKPPNPPDPPDPPNPPDPPVPVPGEFRVLIVYESSANLTREQLNIVNSTAIIAYLDRKTVKTEGGKGWRRWDKDVNVERENSTFKALWTATKPQISTLPAIVIVNGTKGTVYPLPATEAETLAFLKKQGGE